MTDEKKDKKKKEGDAAKKSKSSKKGKKEGDIDDSEPMNPALKEPDAKAIVNRGETAAAPSVSVDRKKELLIQARGDRRKWVQKVPLPYSSQRDRNNVWSVDDRLHNVESSLACKRLPVATKVLSELYGLETKLRTTDEVAERVNGLIAPFVNEENVLERGEEILEEVVGNDDSEIVKAYLDFTSTLLRPECALLVQGMRNFVGNLSGNTTERVAISLKNYVDSTYESLKSHVAWKDRCDIEVRRSLESFIYGQSQAFLNTLPWGGLFTMSEEKWNKRIDALQFVKPLHLEIECLSDESVDVDELLKVPIEALLSIEQFYSPYEKLQRILAMYQGVNAALSEALNQNKALERKLPSADDVLPTIILSVIRSKTMNMFRTLQFVEIFSPQEYLRGEAGYAYTNLYGAVQFLHDMDMEKLDSLSISPEEFRKHMAESASQTQKRLSLDIDKATEDESDFSVVQITARDVRKARLDGEQTDFDWASKRQQQYALEEHKRDEDVMPVSLPDGFTRQYNFIGTRPEEVRISDLPQLLSEYRTLVHVTEQLLGERAARLASEKRRKDAARSQMIDDAFLGIDGSPSRDKSLNS